jgi:hypothetical protein
MLLAQALVEHGMLDAMVTGIAHGRDRLEIYIGRGNTVYLLIGAGVVLLFWLLKPRR